MATTEPHAADTRRLRLLCFAGGQGLLTSPPASESTQGHRPSAHARTLACGRHSRAVCVDKRGNDSRRRRLTATRQSPGAGAWISGASPGRRWVPPVVPEYFYIDRLWTASVPPPGVGQFPPPEEQALSGPSLSFERCAIGGASCHEYDRFLRVHGYRWRRKTLLITHGEGAQFRRQGASPRT